MADETNVAIPDELTMQAQEGRVAWRRLGLRLRGIKPAGWLRVLLVLGAAVGLTWLIRESWLGLIPFILGGFLAYLFLPVVNWLDKFLPRWLASLFTMLGALAFFVFFLSQFVPFVARQVNLLAAAAPSDEQMVEMLENINAFVGDLPAPVSRAVNNWFETVPDRIEEGINTYTDNLLNNILRTLLGLFDAVGFIFGFLVVPTWLLTVLNEQKKGKQAINRLLPKSVQPDFWALLRITDRVFSTFVRGQLLISLAVGVLTYLGLLVAEWLLQIDATYLPVLAMFSGIMAFIPTLGSFLGSVPIILIALVNVSPEAGLYVLIVYLVVWLIIGNFVAPAIEKRVVDIHPALLIVIIVMLSELGFIWVLIAAPLTAIIRDLFRYVYGRLSEPPRPAGVLPGLPLPKSYTSTQPAAPPRVPLVYRRGRASRRT